MKVDLRAVYREVAGMPFHFIGKADVVPVIESWRRAGRREMIIVNNPHAVMLCHRDAEMREATLRAGLVVPDGVGVVVAAMLLGYGRQHRVTGPALTLDVCDRGREFGYRHFFYGGSEGVPEKLAEGLKRRYPGLIVAGTYSPPFRPLTPEEDERVVREINSTRPDIVWVGLGAPKQERWMLHHHHRVRATALIGVGAAFDFHSGNVPWAPVWVRKLGLEWAHRLCVNPRRMWRRNLDSPRFLLRVLAQACRTELGIGARKPPQMDPAPTTRVGQCQRTRRQHDQRLAEWCEHMLQNV
jgi:N-acetylglucosaminyldiphosphoundecaprenol N-acetyl-beta-D-mannosaminyltransferase